MHNNTVFAIAKDAKNEDCEVYLSNNLKLPITQRT